MKTRFTSELALPDTAVPGTSTQVELVIYCKLKAVGGEVVSSPMANWALPTGTGNGKSTSAQCGPVLSLCQQLSLNVRPSVINEPTFEPFAESVMTG